MTGARSKRSRDGWTLAQVPLFSLPPNDGEEAEMLRKYALITSFSLGLGLGGSAVADDVADQVAAMPGGVEDVSIGGSWQDGDRNGAYRLVVTRTGSEKIPARLFIQWIAYGDSGQAIVADSIEIKELTELGVDVANLSTEADDQGLSVFVDTMSGTGDVGETYELHVFSPTDYMFGPASN
jgi:hypothetical protein